MKFFIEKTTKEMSFLSQKNIMKNEGECRYYERLKAYLNEHFNVNLVILVHKIINGSRTLGEGVKNKVSVPVLFVQVVKQLMLNEFDIIYCSIILENICWYFNNYDLNDVIYLVCFDYIKILNKNSADVLYNHISKVIVNFSKKFELFQIEKESNKQLYNVTLQDLSKKFDELKRPHNVYCGNNFIDYNAIVDKIVRANKQNNEIINELYNVKKVDLNDRGTCNNYCSNNYNQCNFTNAIFKVEKIDANMHIHSLENNNMNNNTVSAAIVSNASNNNYNTNNKVIPTFSQNNENNVNNVNNTNKASSNQNSLLPNNSAQNNMQIYHNNPQIFSLLPQSSFMKLQHNSAMHDSNPNIFKAINSYYSLGDYTSQNFGPGIYGQNSLFFGDVQTQGQNSDINLMSVVNNTMVNFQKKGNKSDISLTANEAKEGQQNPKILEEKLASLFMTGTKK